MRGVSGALQGEEGSRVLQGNGLVEFFEGGVVGFFKGRG